MSNELIEKELLEDNIPLEELKEGLLNIEYVGKVDTYEKYIVTRRLVKRIDYVLLSKIEISEEEKEKLEVNSKSMKESLDRFNSNEQEKNENEQEPRIDTSKLDNIIKILFKEYMGYIINTDRHLNAIVRKNLRGCIELIEFLNNFEEGNYLGNLEKMREYCDNELIKEISSYENREFLRDILYCEYIRINKRCLLMLNDKVEKYYNIVDKNYIKLEAKIARDISHIKSANVKIKESRVEYGDIVTWLKLYENIINTNEEVKFFEIFKLIYTIRQLMENFTEQEKMLEVLGGDYVGNYLLASENKNQNRKRVNFELPTRSIMNEISTINKKRNSEINNSIFKYMVKPTFGEANYFEKLVRREEKNYMEEEDFKRFKNMTFYRFGLIPYKINKLNNSDKELLEVVNLDNWMEILRKLDVKIQNTRDDFTKIIYTELNKIMGVWLFNFEEIEECDEIEEYAKEFSKLTNINNTKIILTNLGKDNKFKYIKSVKLSETLKDNLEYIKKSLKDLKEDEKGEINDILRLIDEVLSELGGDESLTESQKDKRDEIKNKLDDLMKKYLI